MSEATRTAPRGEALPRAVHAAPVPRVSAVAEPNPSPLHPYTALVACYVGMAGRMKIYLDAARNMGRAAWGPGPPDSALATCGPGARGADLAGARMGDVLLRIRGILVEPIRRYHRRSHTFTGGGGCSETARGRRRSALLLNKESGRERNIGVPIPTSAVIRFGFGTLSSRPRWPCDRRNPVTLGGACSIQAAASSAVIGRSAASARRRRLPFARPLGLEAGGGWPRSEPGRTLGESVRCAVSVQESSRTAQHP